MDDRDAPADCVGHNKGDGVAFTRSARKHRIAHADDTLLVIHAMRMRRRYAELYEESHS